MKNFINFFLKNPLLVHYITIMVVAFGLFGLISMRREARPEVNFDRIAISIPYNGASAEDVEELILKVIEEEIDGIDGIEEYRSTAFEGIGSVSIQIDPDYPYKDEVVDEVQRAIDQIRNLPSDAEDPVLREIKASKITVLSFILVGDVDPVLLRETAEQLKDDLTRLDGVSSVDAEALKDLEFRIEVKPEALKDRSLSVTEIMNTLKNWNRVSPGGEISLDGKTFSIRFDEQLKTIEDVENLTIRSNDAGVGIKIKDIGQVYLKTKEVKQDLLIDGKPGIALSVIKNESADIINVVTTVRRFLEEHKSSLPEGVSTLVYYDDSTRIRLRLKSVVFNAVFGLILVLLALTLFVSTRLALVTSIGIPIAFMGGVGCLYVLGMTLNSLVVLGMIVVLGMLVDDAIVVAENIYSYVERGFSPREAAIKGTAEVAAPVLATVLTTIFAFLPVAFMEGIMGQFLRVIPITVVIILIFSLLEALFVLPSHCVELLRERNDGEKPKEGLLNQLRDKYTHYVRWSIQSGKSVLIIMGVFVVILGLTYGAAKSVKFVLFPAEGIEFMTIRSELPQNTNLEKTKEIIGYLAKRLRSDKISSDIFSLSSQVGAATTGGISGVREQGSHLSQTTLRFTEDPSFLKREKQVIKRVKEIAKEVGQEFGAKLSANIARPGPPVEADVQVVVSSRDFKKSRAAILEIRAFLEGVPGVVNLQSDLQKKSDYYHVNIDKALAVENGFSFDDLTKVVFSAFYGVAATTTRIGDNEVDLVVSFDSENRQNLENLGDLLFLNSRGSLVPLKSFAKPEKRKTQPSIQRLDGSRTISLFGDVEEGKITAAEANARLKKNLDQIRANNPGTRIEVQGSEQQRMEALADTAKLYGFAILAIFMVISLSFRSVGFPLMVLFAVPFGLIGVVWALFLHGKPLSLMGLVGVVGLSGVVVNGSIIFIQFFLEEYRKGVELKEAIITAVSRRFRPIIITSVTTLLGLAPTIYSLGGNDPFVQPLALSLGWGLLVSTVLTLFLLPSFLYGVVRYKKAMTYLGIGILGFALLVLIRMGLYYTYVALT